MTIEDDLKKSIRTVTKSFTIEKRKVKREQRLSESGYSRATYYVRDTFVKEAVERSVEEAYMKASANNTLPAKLRQVMYALRPLVQALTSKPFKNTTLLNYIVEYITDYTTDWDIVFDARGNLLEPHTEAKIPLGTLEVRNYIGNWTNGVSESSDITLSHTEDTKGPINRYRYVLFVEKEGFNELWKAVNLSERYDLAIMSTKGMSVTASRMLVEELSSKGVTIFVMHDFDKSGFSILNTLRSDTARWQYTIEPNVIDFGFRLEDINGLQREGVDYRSRRSPAINLRESGATEEEIAVLVQQGYQYGGWHGERVELNAMDSGQLVRWVEGKLQQHGVEKLIPEKDILAAAYKKMHKTVFLQDKIDAAVETYEENVKVPKNLTTQVEKALKNSKMRWEDAIWEMF